MSPVTYSRKRYVCVCLGCGRLFEAQRTDQITCSGKCRVKAHRSPRAKQVRTLATLMHVPIAGILQASACDQLRPDLAERVKDGSMTLDEVMPELAIAFDKLVLRIVRSADGTA